MPKCLVGVVACLQSQGSGRQNQEILLGKPSSYTRWIHELWIQVRDTALVYNVKVN